LKLWLMDLLVCPVKDCRSPLSIEVYEEHEEEIEGEEVREIHEALITCTKCRRWYPVIDTIPCMLPDSMRMDGKQRREENKFLQRWREKISSEILENGVPFGLSPES